MMKYNSKKISILITSLNDPRVIPLIHRLKEFGVFEIIVADGGTREPLYSKMKALEDNNVKIYRLPGTIADSREGARSKIRGDIVVFIDTDEYPTDLWLKYLLHPILNDNYDFSFGPTVPRNPPKNRIERFINEYDRLFYDVIVRKNPNMGPMGNSAWKREIIDNVSFDKTLKKGGEDYDFNLKATSRGYKGAFAEKGLLFHDQSNIASLWKFLRKRFRYMVGAAVAYRNNRHLRSRMVGADFPPVLTADPLELILLMMKPVAFVASLIIS